MTRNLVGEHYTDFHCGLSPTGKHYHNLAWDAARDENTRVLCDYCRARCRIKGALWAEEVFIIDEQPDLLDLL